MMCWTLYSYSMLRLECHLQKTMENDGFKVFCWKSIQNDAKDYCRCRFIWNDRTQWTQLETANSANSFDESESRTPCIYWQWRIHNICQHLLHLWTHPSHNHALRQAEIAKMYIITAKFWYNNRILQSVQQSHWWESRNNTFRISPASPDFLHPKSPKHHSKDGLQPTSQ